MQTRRGRGTAKPSLPPLPQQGHRCGPARARARARPRRAPPLRAGLPRCELARGPAPPDPSAQGQGRLDLPPTPLAELADVAMSVAPGRTRPEHGRRSPAAPRGLAPLRRRPELPAGPRSSRGGVPARARRRHALGPHFPPPLQVVLGGSSLPSPRPRSFSFAFCSRGDLIVLIRFSSSPGGPDRVDAPRPFPRSPRADRGVARSLTCGLNRLH